MNDDLLCDVLVREPRLEIGIPSGLLYIRCRVDILSWGMLSL